MAQLLRACSIVFLFLPVLSADLQGGDGIERNREAEKEYSARLSTSVAVFETPWFQIIATKSFSSKVEKELAPSVCEAVGDFCRLFDLAEEDRPWDGREKGRLVLLKTRKSFQRYIDLFEKEAHPESLNPSFCEAVQEVQSFAWLEPVPYAVCCGEGAEFDEMCQHIFHLLGNNLLTRYRYNWRFAPPWLHEGYGIYMAVRYAGGNILFLTQGLNNTLFGTGVFSGLSEWARSENWPDFLRNPARRDVLPKLDLLGRLPLDEFSHSAAALSWSFVSFLIETRSQELLDYVNALKELPRERGDDSDWTPTAYSMEAFQKSFKTSMGDLQGEWEAWTEKAYDPKSKGHAGSTKRVPGSVTFDPNRHLPGFSDFESEPTAEEARIPFLKKSGQRLAPKELEEVRQEWEKVRIELAARLATLKAGRLVTTIPSLVHLLEETRADAYTRSLTEKDVLSLLRPGGPTSLFRAVCLYLVERYGMDAALTRLRGAPYAEDVLQEEGLQEEIALLEEAARAETGVFLNLAAIGAEVSIDLWPSPLVLESLEGGDLVFTGQKPGETTTRDPDCAIEDLGDRVRITCPPSRVSPAVFVQLCEGLLQMDPKENQGLFRLFYLFRGDRRGFEELGQGGADLAPLLEGYEGARDEADLIAILAGAGTRTVEETLELAARLCKSLEKDSLYIRQRRRLEGVLKRVALEDRLFENRYLRTFKGFRGAVEGGDRVEFLYTFDDPGELGDFCEEALPLKASLNARYKVDPSLSHGVFEAGEGKAFCRRLGFLATKPSFAGAIDARIRLRVRRDQEGSGEGPFYILFGYGLNEKGGYVAISSLTYLEARASDRDAAVLLKATDVGVALDDDKPYTLTLKGSADRIEVAMEGLYTQSFEHIGIQPGRVFLWVYGPRLYEVEELKIVADIDPLWIVR